MIFSHFGSFTWIFYLYLQEFPSDCTPPLHHRYPLHPPSTTRAKNPPSARSGHRMVVYKRLLMVFGGFHDNALSDFRYHDDVHSFNLDTYEWTKLAVAGTPPPQRSGE